MTPKYIVVLVQPIEPAVYCYHATKQDAFNEARKHIGNTSRVYTEGRLIADKQAGTDRLNHYGERV
jgi:hypothetical protein